MKSISGNFKILLQEAKFQQKLEIPGNRFHGKTVLQIAGRPQDEPVRVLGVRNHELYAELAPAAPAARPCPSAPAGALARAPHEPGIGVEDS